MPLWFLSDEHRRSLDAFSEYLDGRLEPQRRARLEAHLSRCSACRTELEALRATVAHLRALPRAPVPRSFRISESQVTPPAPSSLWYGLLPGLRLASAVATVLLVAVIATDALFAPQAASVFTGVTASIPAAREAPAPLPPSPESGAAEVPARGALSSEVGGASRATPEVRRPSAQEDASKGLRTAPGGAAGAPSPAPSAAGLPITRIVELFLLAVTVILLGTTIVVTLRKKRTAR